MKMGISPFLTNWEICASDCPFSVKFVTVRHPRVTMFPVPGTLVINEIYLSLQGESTFAGLPCIFVRLTACNLRCSYCDTAYAFTEGAKKTLAEVQMEVNRLAKPFHQ